MGATTSPTSRLTTSRPTNLHSKTHAATGIQVINRLARYRRGLITIRTTYASQMRSATEAEERLKLVLLQLAIISRTIPLCTRQISRLKLPRLILEATLWIHTRMQFLDNIEISFSNSNSISSRALPCQTPNKIYVYTVFHSKSLAGSAIMDRPDMPRITRPYPMLTRLIQTSTIMNNS